MLASAVLKGSVREFEGAASGGNAVETVLKIDRADGRMRTPTCTTTEGNRPMAQSNMAQSNEEAHWRKTTNLMLIHLGIWFFFGYIIHMFVHALNKVTIPILGFPLGFYMAAQGSLIVFVAQLFLFAKQQNKIDREFGYHEED
jgi:putative solute:sodium symporter small subunit